MCVCAGAVMRLTWWHGVIHICQYAPWWALKILIVCVCTHSPSHTHTHSYMNCCCMHRPHFTLLLPYSSFATLLSFAPCCCCCPNVISENSTANKNIRTRNGTLYWYIIVAVIRIYWLTRKFICRSVCAAKIDLLMLLVYSFTYVVKYFSQFSFFFV